MPISIHQHNVSCSTILAAALADLFPDSKLLSFEATEKCFICDFTLPFPFTKDMLPLLEDRMRAWIKKDLPFQQVEMMPANAAQFFEHQGKPTEAAKVRFASDLVSLIRLDHFSGISPGKPLPTTSGIKFFKLVQAKTMNGWIRLIGTASFSKEELKVQIEECKNLPDHLALIEELHLFKQCPQGWLWTPRGESLKKNIIELTLQQLPNVDPIATPALDEKGLLACHASYIKATGRSTWELIKLAPGPAERELFTAVGGVADRIFTAAEEKSVISFLQIIAKFLRIFTFEFEVVVVGKVSKLLRDSLKQAALKTTAERGERPSIEFRLRDALGRSWAGPRLRHEEKAGVVAISLFYSLERFVALFLENSEPLGIRPERTLHERVPYSIVLDERVRFNEMNLETLIGRLRQFESQ
jgi:hypothetical protein